MANCVIFHTPLDMMVVIRALVAKGWAVDPDDVATMSPYLTARIKRFGEYLLTSLTERPEDFEPHLDLSEIAA